MSNRETENWQQRYDQAVTSVVKEHFTTVDDEKVELHSSARFVLTILRALASFCREVEPVAYEGDALHRLSDVLNMKIDSAMSGNLSVSSLDMTSELQVKRLQWEIVDVVSNYVQHMKKAHQGDGANIWAYSFGADVFVANIISLLDVCLPGFVSYTELFSDND